MVIPAACARGYADFDGTAAEFTSDSDPAWPQPRRASPGAPNVIVVLVDDLGFSDLGPFGGEIDTPHIDRLAGAGWTFTNYHTNPVCSPSRASLMTGLNPHRAGFGTVAHVDPGFPGYSCELPSDAPTLAESLRAGGYATFMVGKWHLTLESKMHDGADRSTWPLQRGFDRYFGSMDGFTALHHPHRLVEDNSPVDLREYPDGFFLTDELTDRAIRMIDELRVNDADKPFFLYFAHTAVHGPLQAKPDDIAKYRGAYDAGWDEIRRQRFERQRALGIVPGDAALPPHAPTDGEPIPAWDELTDDERELFARHMEVYAAAVDEVDQSLGRLLNHLDALGERENTIVLLASDNGGTAEGRSTGTRSYFAQFGIGHALPEDWVPDVPRVLDLIGGPRVYSHYPAGWARASNTPFRSFKGSVYEGGVHAPLVISWPAREKTHGGMRDQYVYVADVAPTVLDLTGVPPLDHRAGAPAAEIDGRSFAAMLTDRAAPARKEQLYECFGLRGMYRDGWKAVSPSPPTREQGAAGGEWELYDLRSDPTESADLAGARPDLTDALASAWREGAWHNTVFPLDDDGTLHRVHPSTDDELSRAVRIPAFSAPLERFRSARLTVLRSFRVVFQIDTTTESAGVLLAHGDQGGGYSLRIEAGAWRIAYNAYGTMLRASSSPLPPGAHDVEWRFDERDGLRWDVSVVSDGALACRLDNVPMILGMAPFTGISVGYDFGSPVDWDMYEIHRSFPLTGATLRSAHVIPGSRSEHDPTILREIGAAVADLAD
ncbi:arylsulfatase [Microbacterium karelineae]|uniref:arylsulfatase n=1 Tax=Microbacterium karelineae TaxID=2654283 RepID=UPI0012E9A47E|nr:arylsulfatase [Microbacterium karelineae]